MGKSKRIKKKVSTYLDPKIHEALDIYCKENQLSKSEVIAIVLTHFLACQLMYPDMPDKVDQILDELTREDLVSKHNPTKTKINENHILSTMLFEILQI